MRKQLAITCLLASTLPTHAQFWAKPSPAFDGGNFECSVVREQPKAKVPDKNPVYKINVDLYIDDGKLQGINVVHTRRNGAIIDRSTQYSKSSIGKTPNKSEWYWKGHRDQLQMLGKISYNTKSDDWNYSETISKNGKTMYQMFADCYSLYRD